MATEKFTGSQTDAALSDVDLRGKEFHAARYTATGITLAGAGANVAGIISEGKDVGLHSSIKTGNILKAVAGGAIAAGARVASNAAGRFVTAGVGTESFGTAIHAASGDGVLFDIQVDRTRTAAA